MFCCLTFIIGHNSSLCLMYLSSSLFPWSSFSPLYECFVAAAVAACLLSCLFMHDKPPTAAVLSSLFTLSPFIFSPFLSLATSTVTAFAALSLVSPCSHKPFAASLLSFLSLFSCLCLLPLSHSVFIVICAPSSSFP